MIECVNMYRTNDGQLHNSAENAKKYIENGIQEELNEILKKANMAYYKDLIAAITALAGDIGKAKIVQTIYNKWLAGADETEEREE